MPHTLRLVALALSSCRRRVAAWNSAGSCISHFVTNKKKQNPKTERMQSHVNNPGAEGGSAHRAGGNSGASGPSVSPHNAPEGGAKRKVQHRGSRSVDEYTRLDVVGEGMYGQVPCGG